MKNMRNSKFIGVSGRKGSGKDTFVAKFIAFAATRGVTYKRFAFADALKEEVAQALGVPVKWIEDNKNDPAIRHLLQFWGTDIRRKFFGDNYWINKVAEKLSFEPPHVRFIISDVRFHNEALFILKPHGVLARVNSLKALEAVAENPELAAHSSETIEELPQHYSVNNSKDLDHLDLEVAEFWKYITHHGTTK